MTAETEESPESGRTHRAVVGLAILLIGAGIVCNPAGYTLLLPGGDHLQSVVLRIAGWIVAATLTGGGLLLIRYRRTVSLGNLVLLACTCILSFVLVEVGLSLYGVDPIRRVVLRTPEPIPWWEVSQETGTRIIPGLYEGDWPVNADGFPDTDEFQAATAMAHTTRILLLGDSFAFGIRASTYDRSFAEVIKHDLEPEFDPIVWNTAIPGTGQKQHLLSLKEYFPRMQPQAVVLGFCLNDFDNNLYPVGSHYVFEYGNWINRYELMPDGSVRTLTPDQAYRRALAVQTLQDVPKTSRILTLLASLGWNLEMRLRTRNESSAPPATAADTPDVRITRDLLREMKEYVETRGSFLVLLIIPSRGDLAAKSRQYHDAVALCEELHLDYIEIINDLTPADYERPPGVHWTDSGHEKAGKALAARVRALLEDREDSTPRND